MDVEEFASAADRHRRELEVHCYRMMGSFSEAEDLVQETFERAWRAIDQFEESASLRAWLYKIATNACIDSLRRRRRRRTLPFEVMDPVRGAESLPTATGDHLWLEPFPDRILTCEDANPGEETVHRETIELTFITAVQHLSPLQRAVFISRDVMGWTAKATAVLLDTSEPVKSALQRARATIREHLPERREEWSAAKEVSEDERRVVQRYIDAHQQDGIESLAEVLAEDVRIAYPNIPLWSDSRDAFIEATREFAPPGEYLFLSTTANLQPAVAIYLRSPGETAYRLTALELLRIEDGKVTEIVDFDPSGLSPVFGLEPTISQ